jgi:hypothetical protein
MAAERLIDLDAKKVTAVPLAHFIQSLHARPDLGEPQYVCPTIMEMADFSEITDTPTLKQLLQR